MSYSNDPILQARSLVVLTLALATGAMAQPSTNKPVSAPIRGELIAAPKPPAPKAAAPVAVATPPAGDKAGLLAVNAGVECPSVGFDILSSFDLDIPYAAPKPGQPDEVDQQLPPEIKNLDRKRIYIQGYMTPVTVVDGKTTEFVITKDPMQCCYSVAPRPIDWITVKTKGKAFDIMMEEPVTIQGTLHVGANRDSYGDVTSIYRLDGENFLGTREIPEEKAKK